MASTLGTVRQYLPVPAAPTACRYAAIRCAQADTRERRTLEVRRDVEAQAMAMPRTDPAAAADGSAELERLWYELEVPKGVRAELIDGELVVSPTGSVWHSAAIDKLMDQLVDLKRRRGWISIHTSPCISR